jgi:aryl-alcohol dehydrogenase-like predicted oxidoreductase
MGVTFYDTSDLYGYGHSESLIGAVFKDLRAEVVIASKVGYLKSYGPQDFSPEYIRKSLEGSLRRLQTDYIDLYQLHDPPMDLLENDERILDTLHSLKQEGKVRAFGVSLRSPGDGLVAIQKLGLWCMQVNFNMVDQRAMENGLMALCESEGVGFICRTPLCFGFLTGKYDPETKFAAYDHRSAWSPEQVALWASAPQLFTSTVTDQK